MDGPANIRADAFAGTAEAYARHRPPYPDALISALTPPAPGGRLLDLACGPGRVALRLAGVFDTIWAVDLEPQMVTVGRREAKRLGAHNIAWIVGPAERLDAPAGAFDLVTIGEAFHRLDRALIAERAVTWLRPGGRLAIIGSDGILGGPEPWQQAVTALARRFTAAAFPAGWARSRGDGPSGPEEDARCLREAGFAPVVQLAFAGPHAWTFEAILGYLESTSVCSRRILADSYAEFVLALEATLAPYEEDGAWRETLSFGLTVATKPWPKP